MNYLVFTDSGEILDDIYKSHFTYGKSYEIFVSENMDSPHECVKTDQGLTLYCPSRKYGFIPLSEIRENKINIYTL